MKTLQNTIVIAILAVLSAGTLTEAGLAQQTTPSDPDLKIIEQNTMTVAGRKFPKLPPSNSNAKLTGQSTQSCCNVGDTRTHIPIDISQETQQQGPKGKVTYQATIPYSPPSTCWVISTYRLDDYSMSGSSRTLTAVPANYSFLATNQYQQTYTQVIDYVTQLNILDKYKADLKANIKIFTDNYASYSSSVSASHGSLALYVRLEAKGVFKGRSWYQGKVNVTETCCPPEIRDASALKTALIAWVNNTVNALPNKGKGRFVIGTPAEIKLNNLKVND